jgi:Ala-tRNA(Pro) deacylase
MWLVTCLAVREFRLKPLAVAVGAKQFAMGSEERLMKYLGLRKGAVTAFGVLNDKAGAVHVVLDRAVFEHDLVNLHPLDNARTTAISPADLVRFLEAEDHAPELLDFEGLGEG